MGRICRDVVFGTICPKGGFWNDLSWRFGCQKPSKNQPKTIKKRQKSIQKALRRPRCVQKTFLYRFFVFRAAFRSPRGLPKWSPNRYKSSKSVPKLRGQKYTFSNTFCSRFFIVLTSQNEPQIVVFLDFYANIDFVKILVFL